MSIRERFTCLAQSVSQAAGHPAAFGLAALSIIAWAVCGPWAGYSDHWQIIINTGTTIVTFLMVFLIQASQNRDGAAIQRKLDTLIAALDKADNALIGIEKKPDAEL